jgi:hypothetical protein
LRVRRSPALAVQADVSGIDQKGGRALAAGVAGELLGVSTFVRHAEYRGGFIDETIISGDLGSTAGSQD